MNPVSIYGKPINNEMTIISSLDNEEEIIKKAFTSKIEANAYMQSLIDEFSQFMEPTDFYFSLHHIYAND